jgi:3-dehydroquinate synthase
MISQQISVQFEFPIFFTRDIFSADNATLANAISRLEQSRKHRVLFVVDSGVTSAHPSLLSRIRHYTERHSDVFEMAGSPQIVPGGETSKNDETVLRRLQGAILRNKLDRQSFIVAIGGGAVLDMTGYVAATAHRGIRLIRVPTTVLAQNDSGVGVKNGINAFNTKNYFGTFAPPFSVINDADFLSTLSQRDRRSGISEAVKVAVLKDRFFFHWIDKHADDLRRFDPESVEYMIRECAIHHLNHIAKSGDPFEMGSSRPLDFGHWAAHKLESLSGHTIRHGEAVAIGIAIDTKYSVEIGKLSIANGERIINLLQNLGFDLWNPLLETTSANGKLEILMGLSEFQEHIGGDLSITLLQDIGVSFDASVILHDPMMRSIRWLKDHCS